MIKIEDLSIRQGAFRLDHISLRIPAGKYGVLMGKTGCGKTTILETVAGLRSVVGGKITLGDHDVTNLPRANARSATSRKTPPSFAR
jgi:molybdate/tungstate transport system ATP-binding protein